MFTLCRNLTETLPDRAKITVYANPTVQPFDDVIKFNPSDDKRLMVKVDLQCMMMCTRGSTYWYRTYPGLNKD